MKITGSTMSYRGGQGSPPSLQIVASVATADGHLHCIARRERLDRDQRGAAMEVPQRSWSLNAKHQYLTMTTNDSSWLVVIRPGSGDSKW